LFLLENAHLEKCPCCGLPQHMIVKPTKKALRYHAYCPYCKFTAFFLKLNLKDFLRKSLKQKKVMDYNMTNEYLFDDEGFAFMDVNCFLCLKDLPVKKCKSKRRKMVSVSCSDCTYRFFIPVIFFDTFF